MQATIDARRAEARRRLHAALLAGEDTMAFRAACAQLEGDAEATAEHERAIEREREQRRAAAVAANAAEIARQASARVAAVVDLYEIPKGVL